MMLQGQLLWHSYSFHSIAVTLTIHNINFVVLGLDSWVTWMM